MRLFFLLILLHNPLSAAVLHTGYEQPYTDIDNNVLDEQMRMAAPLDMQVSH